MKSVKRLGIWMDHSTANIFELLNDTVISKTLESIPAFPDQVENLRLDESLMHNKEQNQYADFYKKLSYIINDYSEVLLFGPTDAKSELFNVLQSNRKFEKIKISVQPADNMTDNQQKAFVKDFFNTPDKE
ncbi:hypothetical protein D1164_19965 [Mariniphaga sediminis]|jgi:hypothetical protein|uniref:Translational machinery protein n=1 Tax=Mariniphaga sediminis TaxID=1628158 RepID=A0A399CVF7_9BACT|nr:hypothetical protein [Mariniphaga sediminis]RIH63407.1 hypothetical protein D1164_19965 [Mariniphaga sediminis]